MSTLARTITGAQPAGRVHRTRALAVALITLPLLFAGCSHGSRTALPSDPKPVTVSPDQATTLALGGGAHLIIPPGAMTAGAKVHATYRGRPEGRWDAIRATRDPIELVSDPPNAIHGLLTLEFPVPAPAQGTDPAWSFGISTFDAKTGVWTPFPSSYDAARHMVVAEIPHFSWWNPFSWDWASIGAQVNQDVGQVLDRRAPEAHCTSGPPSWVRSITVTNDAAVAVRGCAQSQGDIVEVRLVNNRPYGVVLSYGSPVKWGWHEAGSTTEDRAMYKLADRMVTPQQLYLPPLGRASVGVYRTTGFKQFRIGTTRGTMFLDFARVAADQALAAIPDVGECLGYLSTYTSDLSPSDIRGVIVAAGDCLLQTLEHLDDKNVKKLAAIIGKLKTASVVGMALDLAGVEWQVLDLFVDKVVVGDAGGLGAGFTLLGGPQSTGGGSGGGSSGGSGGSSSGGPTVPETPAPLTFHITTNPVPCDGATHILGTVSGALPGETITLTSPSPGVRSLASKTANGDGVATLYWDCNSSEPTYTWTVDARGQSSGRSGEVTFSGAVPHLAFSLDENPFRCDGTTHHLGWLSGAQPGETISFSSPSPGVGALDSGAADTNGRIEVTWECGSNEPTYTWELDARGQSSGRTGSVTFSGSR